MGSKAMVPAARAPTSPASVELVRLRPQPSTTATPGTRQFRVDDERARHIHATPLSGPAWAGWMATAPRLPHWHPRLVGQPRRHRPDLLSRASPEGVGSPPARGSACCFGRQDKLIDPRKAHQWLLNHDFQPQCTWADAGHRVAPHLFKPWITSISKGN